MKKILFINRTQFGYNIDSYNYCKYLKSDFDITYLCLDIGKERIEEKGVKIIYVRPTGGYLKRGIALFKACYKYIQEHDYDLVFILYFPNVFFLKLLLPSTTYVFDVRTGSISKKFIKRTWYNTKMLFESLFFKNITIISSCLREKLYLNPKKSHILPLGSDILSVTKKDFSSLKLLYVGTFTNRNIYETIIGLALFLKNNNILVSYDIFGDGLEYDTKKLVDTIEKYDLTSVVILHGRKTHKDIKPYYDKCNIGVSYIPMTDYYDCQPPTKTYEYVNAGLVCIATKTSENKKLVNEENGILCQDTASSFCNALEEFHNTAREYSSDIISDSLSSYTWKNIVHKNLKKYILNKIEN